MCEEGRGDGATVSEEGRGEWGQWRGEELASSGGEEGSEEEEDGEEVLCQAKPSDVIREEEEEKEEGEAVGVGGGEEGECEVVEVEKALSPQFKVASQYRTLYRQLQQIEVYTYTGKCSC